MPRSTILWLTCYACISSCEQIYSAEYLPRHKASISSICGVWITLACCNQTTCDISRHLYYITMSLTTNTTASLMMQGVAYKGIPHQVSVVELPSPTHRNIMTASLNIKSSKCTSTSKMRGKKKQFSGSQTTSTSVVRESNDGFAVLMRSSAFMRGCCSTDGTINPNFLQQCSTFIFYTAASYVKSLTSTTAWGDARCREMLLCSHLLLLSSSLKLDVVPVLTSSPAVLLAYERCA